MKKPYYGDVVLTNQIEGNTDNFASEVLDSFQCCDWRISFKKFVELHIEEFTNTLMEYVKEYEEEMKNSEDYGDLEDNEEE